MDVGKLGTIHGTATAFRPMCRKAMLTFNVFDSTIDLVEESTNIAWTRVPSLT